MTGISRQIFITTIEWTREESSLDFHDFSINYDLQIIIFYFNQFFLLIQALKINQEPKINE